MKVAFEFPAEAYESRVLSWVFRFFGKPEVFEHGTSKIGTQMFENAYGGERRGGDVERDGA